MMMKGIHSIQYTYIYSVLPFDYNTLFSVYRAHVDKISQCSKLADKNIWGKSGAIFLTLQAMR